MNRTHSQNGCMPGHRQAGMMTTFTGVMILVLLTLMMFFAIRVGVFDQRVSASDLRQKRAFHVAESANQQAKEYFLTHSFYVARPDANISVDGSIDGWLSAGNERWQRCSNAGIDLNASGTHPCYGEPIAARRASLYYWSWGSPASTYLPVDTDSLVPGTTEKAQVQALLCLLDIDYDATTPVQGCSTNTSDPTAAGYVDGKHYMITLLARGEADCDNGANCKAEALVKEQISNFGGVSGGQAPSVPLVTKSTFPPSGTAEIVPNPNSGGVGVPVSVWMNGNTSCNADGSVISPSSGSWATCEMHEWYGVDQMPSDYTCPGNCSCTKAESISYTHGTDDILGIDLVQDSAFPCDLFQFYFGVARADYELVKGYSQVLNDCTSLGPNSTGIFWISGPLCEINANTSVGGPNNPVLLISAATETRINGGAKIYGVLYMADVEDPNAALYALGTNTVYGQVIVDAQLGQYNGTFQVVYNEKTIGDAIGGGGLGNVIGGWSDFHPSWQ